MVSNYSVNISPYVVPPSVMYKKPDITETNTPVKNNQDQDTFKQNNENNRQQNKYQGAIDYSSSKINIAQILTDFKNTINAISTPEDIKGEIDGYLHLIEIQSKKELPSPEIIKSNLRISAKILDEFISKTLQKQSKVVEEWINALLLQQVDYKLDPSKAQKSAAEQIINGEQTSAQQQTETTKQPENEDNDNFFITQSEQQAKETSSPLRTTTKDVYIPEDKTLRKLYAVAISYTNKKDYKNALKTYKSAFDNAMELGDYEAQANIYHNTGDIFNKQNFLAKALICYNQAAENTQSLTLKGKAHQKMGKIYNELNKYEPSMQHYFESLSLKGETEDIRNQTRILEDIGEMHSLRYVTKEALSYFKLGLDMAKETKDTKRMSSIFSKTARMYKQIGEDEKAEKYYTRARQTKNLSDKKMSY